MRTLVILRLPASHGHRCPRELSFSALCTATASSEEVVHAQLGLCMHLMLLCPLACEPQVLCAVLQGIPYSCYASCKLGTCPAAELAHKPPSQPTGSSRKQPVPQLWPNSFRTTAPAQPLSWRTNRRHNQKKYGQQPVPKPVGYRCVTHNWRKGRMITSHQARKSRTQKCQGLGMLQLPGQIGWAPNAAVSAGKILDVQVNW